MQTEPVFSTVSDRLPFAALPKDRLQALLQPRWKRSDWQARHYFHENAVALDVSQALRTLTQMLLDGVMPLRRQLVSDEVHKQLDEVAAGDHATLSSK